MRQVTLKADGHLGCDDSVGYGINLGHVSLSPGWRLRDTLNGPIYGHVRSAFKEGRVPWPGTCEGCDLFSSAGRPIDTLDTRLELLVEPTLACNISCACCMRKQIIAKGRPTSSLDPDILRRFVDSARSDGIAIDQVHYIGWGEPLMHGNVRTLFDIVHQGAPLAHQMVTTAGNVDFYSTIGDAPIDRLVVSADGSRQGAYARYRRGGDLETVIRFMRDCRGKGSAETFLEWKYILFEFNDSDEDLLEAQAIADDIGVDSLLFIITNSKWHSTRYTVENSHTVPIRSSVASVCPAAAMMAVAMECDVSAPDARSQGFGHIDICALSVGRFLTVEGWAYDRAGSYADRLDLVLDGVVCARGRTYLRRVDVISAHPSAQGAKAGFMFRIPIDPAALPSTIEVQITGPSGQAVLGGQTLWRKPQSEMKRRADLPRTIPRLENSSEASLPQPGSHLIQAVIDKTRDRRLQINWAAEAPLAELSAVKVRKPRPPRRRARGRSDVTVTP